MPQSETGFGPTQAEMRIVRRIVNHYKPEFRTMAKHIPYDEAVSMLGKVLSTLDHEISSFLPSPDDMLQEMVTSDPGLMKEGDLYSKTRILNRFIPTFQSLYE